MKKTTQIIVTLLFSGIMLSGCGQYIRLEKEDDYSKIFNGAVAYYESGKYAKAKALFEKISSYYRGSLEAEKVQLYWAYSEFHQGLYQLSSYRFKNFFETYGRSDYVEEAEYMYAYSLYKSSPDYNLDQSSSKKAVVALQDFINKYPGSVHTPKSNDMIDELQVRFETKAYENAKLYHKIGSAQQYKNRLEAALVTFETFRKDFPDSKYNEELLWLSIETTYRIAENSIRQKQLERYSKVVELYKSMENKYPSTEYLGEAKPLYEKAVSEIEKLNSIN